VCFRGILRCIIFRRSRACLFEGLCEGVSTRFGLQMLAKSVEGIEMFEMEIVQQMHALKTKILKNGTACRACLVRCALRWCEYSIWATNARKITRKDTPDLLFRFPKSSFEEHTFVEQSPFRTFLCLPNEYFGKRNHRSGVSFRGTLRWLVAQIEYSHPRKAHRKDTPDTLFRFSKSSFGSINFDK